MEYIHGLTTQGRMFLFSLGFGFMLGFLYDIFKFLRALLKRSKGVTLFADLAYTVICTLLTFLFLLVLDGGRIRFYSVGGEALGFLVYYFSLGIIISRFLNLFSDCIKRFLCVIFSPFRFVFCKTTQMRKHLLDFFKKILKKFKKKQNLSCQNNSL